MRFLGGILTAILVSAAMAGASIVIPFSGSGASGTIAPGEAGTINQLSLFNSGSPGVGLSFEMWNGSSAIEDFTITFLRLPAGVPITNLEMGPTCGTGNETVFLFRLFRCLDSGAEYWRRYGHVYRSRT